MEDRRCRRCKQLKPLGDRHKTASRIYGYCKKCLYKAQQVRWNRQKMRASNTSVASARFADSSPHSVLFDFDHRTRQDKECSWNKLRLRSWKGMQRELDKCDLVCCI